MGGALHDTICAVATPVGEGGIGIIRISGEKAIEVVSGLVRLRSGKNLESLQTHRLYCADLLESSVGFPSPFASDSSENETRSPFNPHYLDEALIVMMRAPHSFTGETVVEIHCHGGPLVLQLMCESLMRRGARLAEPGEFTKRAFLNGRLDLTQAEAVLDTIRAKTSGSLKIAQEQLRGSLSGEIEHHREKLVGLLAHIEAAIDFSEEGLTFVPFEKVEGILQETIQHLGRLTQSFQEGRILREGVVVAIIGRPNVGKSSLLNALVQTDRAIVTSVPGTTRDILEETLNIRGIPVRLLDTAGIQETLDPVEREGIRRCLHAIDRAELLLIMVDGSVPFTDDDRALIKKHSDKKRLIIVNKCDLSSRTDVSDLIPAEGQDQGSSLVWISAKTGSGLEELRDRIRNSVLLQDFEPHEGILVTRLRHRSALERATAALLNCSQSVRGRLSDEFVAVDLRAAVDALGEISGAVSTDDILDRIFQEFCIGK